MIKAGRFANINILVFVFINANLYANMFDFTNIKRYNIFENGNKGVVNIWLFRIMDYLSL